jgi:hypothetical protein
MSHPQFSLTKSIAAELSGVLKNIEKPVDDNPVLFKSRITDSKLMMATGGVVAHLFYLLVESEVSINTDQSGVRWFQIRQ